MPTYSLTFDLSDEELASLRFAAAHEGVSIEAFCLNHALNRAKKLSSNAANRTRQLSEPLAERHYQPENPNSGWVKMFGSARGLYASPVQAVQSVKESRHQ